MSSYADLPILTHLVCHHTLTYQSSTVDRSESVNLRNDPAHAALFETLAARLAARGATGPPLASAFPLGEKNSTVAARSCARGEATGYLLPDDF